MRILHLISSGGHYGAENMIVNLAKSLDKLGHRSTLGVFYNVHRPNQDLAEVAQDAGIPVEKIVCSGRMNWDAVRAIIDCARRHEIDIIHAHGYKADAYALAARRQIRVPLVSTCHNWPLDSFSLRVYQLLDVLCLRHFDRAVAVSADVAAILRRFGVPKDKIITIPNGVNISLFQAARPTVAETFRKRNGLIVGTAAQLTPKKGQEYLLRAAPEILAQFPDTVFLFAGDGPARKDLETLAQQLGIGESVLFLGQRRDMPALYASMDIFVLPSLEEGMPMVILEALASRKPVVATPVGDIPKLILHEQTGLLVRPKEVGDLREAMLRLLSDAELRARLGRDGGDWVGKHFSAEAMAWKYAEQYSRLAESCWSRVHYSPSCLKDGTRVR